MALNSATGQLLQVAEQLARAERTKDIATAGQVFWGKFRFIDVCVKRSGLWQIVASQLMELSA